MTDPTEILSYLLNKPVIRWNMIESQITSEVNLNVTHNKTELSLLWMAFCANRHEVVFSLLSNGVRVDLISGFDFTTDVHRACLSQSITFLEILCDYDETSVNCCDVFGRTPLICYILSIFDVIFIPRDGTRDVYITEPVNYELLRLLVSKGANVNAADREKNTCLHYITYNPELVEFFINNGADLTLRNKDGYSAISRILEQVSRYNPESIDYKILTTITVDFLLRMNHDPVKILEIAFSGTADHITLANILGLIFIGNQTSSPRVISLGWEIFRLKGIYSYKHLNNIFNSIVLYSVHDSDVVYYLQNFAEDFEDIYMVLTYNQNNYSMNRTLILYYSIISMCTERGCLRAEAAETFQDMIPEFIVSTRPLRLRTLCRIVIRGILRVEIPCKVEGLVMPVGLKNFLSLVEMNRFLKVENKIDSVKVLKELIDNL